MKSSRGTHLVLVGHGDEVPLEFDGIERFQYGGQRAPGQRGSGGRAATGHGLADAFSRATDDAVERA